MTRAWSRRRVLGAGAALLAGCSAPTAGRTPTTAPPRGTPVPPVEPPEYDPDWTAPATSPLDADVSASVLVKNLEVPWDLDFTPNGDLFITERVGRVNRFSGERIETVLEPADAIDAASVLPGSDERPWWIEGGEGGTMGVAVHPRYPNPAHVYVYYTARADGGRVNRLVRFDAEADEPAGTQETLIDDIPADRVHNGGRITFGPEGYLWVTTGDAEIGDRVERYSQDRGSLAGKVLRLLPDGTAAPANPDLGDDADPRIYTYGHRNPQGIAWLPDGSVVVTEHGQSGFDEVNRLEPGANYGWPDARKGDAYRANPGIHRPVLSTRGTTWAPTGCVFYTGDAVPAWRNRLVVGGLISQQVIVVTLTPDGGQVPPATADGARRHDEDWYDDRYRATSHPTLRDALGRVRLVTQSPDGDLYAITSNRDGRASGRFPRPVDDVLVRLEA